MTLPLKDGWTNKEMYETGQHPDYKLIAKVCTYHDDLCDTGTDEESGFAKTFLADIKCVAMAAHARVDKVLDQIPDAELREKLIIAWLDAFTAGQRFERLRNEGTFDALDGSRRSTK